jgi:hypothetical protein
MRRKKAQRTSALPRGDDAVPAATIRLGDAFENVYRFLAFQSRTPAGFAKELAHLNSSEPIPLDEWLYSIELLLRRCLSEGAIHAYVRDPETGEWLELRSQEWDLEWLEFSGHPREWWNKNIAKGFLHDYVHPDDRDQPGPRGTFIRGMLRPVFFRRDEFDHWFDATFGDKKLQKRGRPPGSGSLERADEPLLQEMHQLIETRFAKSAEDAAGRVAEKASGASFESKRTRLAKRYRKLHSPERN